MKDGAKFRDGTPLDSLAWESRRWERWARAAVMAGAILAAIAVGVVVAIALTGCDTPDPPGKAEHLRVVANRGQALVSVAEVRDDEHGVTCYVNSHAISCLRDSVRP